MSVDHISDVMTREKFKELDRRIDTIEGNVSLTVKNRILILDTGITPVIHSAVEPSMPVEGLVIWVKTQESGPNVVYMSLSSSVGRTWLWMGETV